jgi:hypothetical protein
MSNESKPSDNKKPSDEKEELLDISAILICCLCEETTLDPHTCFNCGQLICLKCDKKLIKPVCPHCFQQRKLISVLNSPIHRISQAFLKHFQVHCCCGWKNSILLLSQHQKAECVLRTVECIHCKLQLTFNQLQKHQEQDCLLIEIDCKECNNKVIRQEMEKHITSDCLHRTVFCTNCKEKMIFKNLESHQKEVCPLSLVFCSICNFMGTRQDFNDKHLKDEQWMKAHIQQMATYINPKDQAQRQQMQQVQQKEEKKSSRPLCNIPYFNKETKIYQNCQSLVLSLNVPCFDCKKVIPNGTACFTLINISKVHCVDCGWKKHSEYGNVIVSFKNSFTDAYINCTENKDLVFKIGKVDSDTMFEVLDLSGKFIQNSFYTDEKWKYISKVEALIFY